MLRRQLAGEAPESRHRETIRGELAGLESSIAEPLDPRALDGSPTFRAGFMAGRLFARLIRSAGRMSGSELLVAAAYGAAIAAEDVDRTTAGPAAVPLLKAHTVGILAASSQGDVSAEAEMTLFRCLADERSVAVTPELVDRYDAWRARRLAARRPA